MTSPKDGGKAARDWAGLSSRQRDLIRKAFDADQAAEKHEQQRARLRGAAERRAHQGRRFSTWIRIHAGRARRRPRRNRSHLHLYRHADLRCPRSTSPRPPRP